MQLPPTSPTPATQPQRGRVRDPERAAAIIRAARELFLEMPFERVSMDAVAARAGVSKVTLYAHHGSKEALFVSAIAEGFSALFGDAADATERGTDLEAILAQFGTQFLGLLLSPEVAALKKVLMSTHERQPQLAARFYEHVISSNASLLAAVLEAAAERGEVVIQEPQREARIFCGMIIADFEARQQLGLSLPGPDEQRRHALRAAAIFTAGVRRAADPT